MKREEQQLMFMIVMTMVGVLICLYVFSGCTTVESSATYEPVLTLEGAPVAVYDANGNVVGIAAKKTLNQTVMVSMGGKLKEGMLDFQAESVAADGSNWRVSSGTNAVGASSPNVIKDVTALASVLGSAMIGAKVQTDMAEIEAGSQRDTQRMGVLSEGISMLPQVLPQSLPTGP